MGRWRFLHAADLHLDRPAVDWGRGRSVPGLDAATASLDAFDRFGNSVSNSMLLDVQSLR